ncbi:MAG: hypothetical protein OXC62_03225, partial [Aestuariivita sp.]|nr:hypothetical protein [Aestuariivita sp.]
EPLTAVHWNRLPFHPRPAPQDNGSGSTCLAGSPQRRSAPHQLAVRNRRCPHQTEVPIPINTIKLIY